jgi:hypothetical protein
MARSKSLPRLEDDPVYIAAVAKRQEVRDQLNAAANELNGLELRAKEDAVRRDAAALLEDGRSNWRPTCDATKIADAQHFVNVLKSAFTEQNRRVEQIRHQLSFAEGGNVADRHHALLKNIGAAAEGLVAAAAAEVEFRRDLADRGYGMEGLPICQFRLAVVSLIGQLDNIMRVARKQGDRFF